MVIREPSDVAAKQQVREFFMGSETRVQFSISSAPCALYGIEFPANEGQGSMILFDNSPPSLRGGISNQTHRFLVVIDGQVMGVAPIISNDVPRGKSFGRKIGKGGGSVFLSQVGKGISDLTGRWLTGKKKSNNR